MPRAVPLAALCFACGVSLSSAAPLEKRVYKVDSVIATMRQHTLTIQAKGAVQTGGWRKARLRVVHSSEAHSVAVEFVAVPPPPGMTVIEALVPVEAALVLRAQPHIVAVRAVAEANEVTSQVLH